MRALRARIVEAADRDAAIRHLAHDSLSNLFLLDLAAQLGRRPAPGEARAELVAVWRGDEIAAVAGLHPTVMLDARADREAVSAFLPFVDRLQVGLIKCLLPIADELWSQLTRIQERRVIVDRIETAYALLARDAAPIGEPPRAVVRRARDSDLEELVIAARESLREEARPDPFLGDVAGFRRWVRGRVARARVVECAGRVAMVGYADVQRFEGWLLQGIYTWPEFRKRGLASLGVSKLCQEAFEAGSEHVQLAVVDGNDVAERLYRKLGFKPFAKLRTILFG
jgi:RimJ/RimL family protein N-acetyltransferase